MLNDISPSDDIDGRDYLFVAGILREMKWGYKDYLEAPSWLIDTLGIMLNLESKKAKQNKKD